MHFILSRYCLLFRSWSSMLTRVYCWILFWGRWSRSIISQPKYYGSFYLRLDIANIYFLELFQEIFYVFLTLSMRGRAYMPRPPHPSCYGHVIIVTIDGNWISSRIYWSLKQLVTTFYISLLQKLVFTAIAWERIPTADVSLSLVSRAVPGLSYELLTETDHNHWTPEVL
jgi:hypothetical protein